MEILYKIDSHLYIIMFIVLKKIYNIVSMKNISIATVINYVSLNVFSIRTFVGQNLVY